jgi:hypothetical protein
MFGRNKQKRGDAPGQSEEQVFYAIMDILYRRGTPGHMITTGDCEAARDLGWVYRIQELNTLDERTLRDTERAYRHVGDRIREMFATTHAGATYPHLDGEEPEEDADGAADPYAQCPARLPGQAHIAHNTSPTGTRCFDCDTPLTYHP